MIGVRIGAAVFVLGLSLAGPHATGVAVADTGADTASPGAAGRDSHPRGNAERRVERTPRVRGQRGQKPAPAAAAQRTPSSRRSAGAATPSPEPPPTAPPKVAAATASPTPVTSLQASASKPVLPGASVTTPASAVTPAAVTPAPAAAHAPELRGAARAVGQLVDSVGDLLANTAVTPVTDLLSGALWLVRRTVIPAGSELGSPAACGLRCTSQLKEAAAGQVLTVTSRIDGEAGSLRDVLSQATSGDVIRFAPRLLGATLTLTEGALDINTSVRIEGTHQTLDAAGASRIMTLDQPGTTIALSGLNFRNGNAPGDPALATVGGAIRADGVTLEINRASFSDNKAVSTEPASADFDSMQSGMGGAIAAFASTVSITDSDFRANKAAGADNNTDQQASSGLGGAIFGENSSLVLINTRFIGNQAAGGSGRNPIRPFPTADGGLAAGGAIFASGGALSATGLTFDRNTATGGDGLDGSPTSPYGNRVGVGGNASGGALWMVGKGRDSGTLVPLTLSRVRFSDNTATGGSAGAQGLPTLAAQQGGRGNGGGFGTAEWVAVSLADVTIRDNLAQGGGVGPNAANAGANTGTGGVAQGGGVFLVSPSSVQAVHLSVRDNTARGGNGADSGADSGTEAGEGGYSFGGGIRVDNATGSLGIKAAIIPVSIRESEFVRNTSAGGQAGTGQVPADGEGAGGLAQGGGLDFTSLFETRLVGTRFIGNTAIAAEGKPAAGGALINPFSVTKPGDPTATLQIQNGLFRGNMAVGGDDAANFLYRRTQGGGFYNLGLGTVVSGSRFVGNSAVGGNDTGSGHVGSGLGGGLYSEASEDPSISIFNTTFVANSALGGRRTVPGQSLVEQFAGEARGGGFCAVNGTTTINGGVFARNRATVRVDGDFNAAGGAVEIAVPGDGLIPDKYTNYLHTTGVRFTSNTASAKNSPALGGALSFRGTAFTDDGSTFTGNTATSGRGAGSAFGGALNLEQTSRLTGTTATFNRALADQGYGGGIALPLGPHVLTQIQTDIRSNRASTAGNQVWWPAGSE